MIAVVVWLRRQVEEDKCSGIKVDRISGTRVQSMPKRCRNMLCVDSMFFMFWMKRLRVCPRWSFCVLGVGMSQICCCVTHMSLHTSGPSVLHGNMLSSADEPRVFAHVSNVGRSTHFCCVGPSSSYGLDYASMLWAAVGPQDSYCH